MQIYQPVRFEMANRNSVEVNEASDSYRVESSDKFVTDGTNWFFYNAKHGIQKATKIPETGKYLRDNLKSNKKFTGCTMLCHQGLILVRHKAAESVPFEVINKSTMTVDTTKRVEMSANQVGPDDSLTWTPVQ